MKAVKFGIYKSDSGELVEGGFFSRAAAQASCDTWNAEEYNDCACTEERYPEQREFFVVRSQS